MQINISAEGVATISIRPEQLLLLLMLVGAAVSLSVAAQGLLRHAWLRSFLLGGTSGLCATYAGAMVPLTIGLSIMQTPVQAVVGAYVIVACAVGWFAPNRRSFPLVIGIGGLLSFLATLQAVALLYPPRSAG